MTELGNTETDQIDSKETISFGEHLFVAREKKGLAVSDVAKAIHLSEDIIDALERSDLSRLPQPAYVQGYLRTYAKHLGISETMVLNEYSRVVPHSLETDLRPRSQLPDQAHSGSPFIKAITIALLVLVFVAGIYGLYSYYSKKVDSRNVVEDSATLENSESDGAVLRLPERDQAFDAEAVDYEATESQSMDSGIKEQSESEYRGDTVATDTDMSSDTLIQAKTAATDEDVSVEEAADTVSQITEVETHPIAAGEDSVELIAQEDSWAEVVDANDVALLYDLVQKEHTVVLRGTAPFDIFLGNAPAIEVRVNGIKIDMTKFVRSNKIAHFNVSTNDQQVVFH